MARDGVLRLDPEPASTSWSRTALAPDGTPRSRTGFIGLVGSSRTSPPSCCRTSGRVPGPVSGRLGCCAPRARTCRRSSACTTTRSAGPRSSLLAGRDPRGAGGRLLADDGTALPPLARAARRRRVGRRAGDATVLVADGHHRYETALAYRRERGGRRRAGGLPAGVPRERRRRRLVIYPTHRIVDGVDPTTSAAAGLLGDAALAGPRGPAEVRRPRRRCGAVRRRAALALVRDGRPGLLADDPHGLLGVASRRTRSSGRRSACDATASPNRPHQLRPPGRRGAARSSTTTRTVAILLRAPTIDEVEEVVDRGDGCRRSRPTSHPKTLDGLVFYGLEDCG